MAALAGVETGSGSGGLSRPVYLLTLVAVTLSSLSVLALYQLVALRAEVKELKSDISRRRGEGQEVRGHVSISCIWTRALSPNNTKKKWL